MATLVFGLPLGGDGFAGSVVDAGPGTNDVTITLATGAVLDPNGVFGVDVTASGLELLANQTAIVYGAGNRPVPKLGATVDIGGTIVPPPPPMQWNAIGNLMNNGRYGHTATLLPNGEMLIVGGLHDVASAVNPGFRQCLSSIEIFNPQTGIFTTAGDSLVRPRGYHDAVRTPGLDGFS